MKAILILAVLGLIGCTNEDHASRALRGAGYTQVEFTGYQFFACSESDQFATGFRAVGPTGMPTTGVVCSGLLKGATVRAD